MSAIGAGAIAFGVVAGSIANHAAARPWARTPKRPGAATKAELFAAPTWAFAPGGPDHGLPTWAQIIDAPIWAQRVLPATLVETGLYASWAGTRISSDVKPFTPQYPLWSDGAQKRRWIYLPGPIDAGDPDGWVFPVGTRLWKEFSFRGRVETRFMIRAADGWHFATYAWTPDGSHAIRASFAGAKSVPLPDDRVWSEADLGARRSTSSPRAGAHGALPVHRLPSQADCKACHENGKTPVLGFSALQLSADRDPHAVHREEPEPGAIDLAWLADRGLVRGPFVRTPYVGGRMAGFDVAPRIAGSAVQRSALGYLHGNCGGCHRAEGPLAGLGMVLAHSLDGAATRTTIGVPSKYMAPALRVAPGDPKTSVLLARMKARHTAAQMPPIGTLLVDAEAIRLVADWIDQLAPTTN